MATPAMTRTEIVTFVQEIHAPLQQVYESFTNRDNASDWLGIDGEVRAVKGGFALYIMSGTEHAHGTFTEVVEGEKLVLTWADGSDHPPTTLMLKFDYSDGVTTLKLKHSGFEDEETATRYENFWKTRLRDLKSILETGERASITERIIIGIIPAPLSEEIAANLNIPVTQGVRVGGLVPDFSAAKAGVQIEDVIVEVAGKTLNESVTISDITANYKPGDVVDVTFYRGAEKHTLPLELKGYPVPDVPENFPAFANQLEQTFTDYNGRLTEVLGGLSENDADKKADNVEFSIREIVASLILSARHNTEYLSTYIQGPRRINPYTRMPARINALKKAYPTLDDLRQQLQRTQAEAVATMREFPDELHTRKHNLWWINWELAYVSTTYDNALEQIEAILKQ